MTKGRRERDRPKAPPGALYNPNKRVKLSYGSESEGEEESVPPPEVRAAKQAGDGGESETVDAKSKSGQQLAERGVDDAQADANVEDDTDEKPVEEQDEGDGDAGTASSYAPRVRKDTRTGMRPALGALSWQEGGDEADGGGSEDEAMAYLRSVRSERQTIPTVLGASRLQSNDPTLDEYAKFRKDHAIVATPHSPAGQRDDPTDPRGVFTQALKKRFLSHRYSLHVSPSPEAVAALDSKHPISFPPMNKKARGEWLRVLEHTTPSITQVRCLDQDVVFTLLKMVQKFYLQKRREVKPITSAWLWSLLARLDDVGAMDNDQVHMVRELGKKAVLVLVSFNSLDAAQQIEDVLNDVAPAQHGIDYNTEESKQPSQAKNQSKVKDKALRENTMATLDSILVIVGDIFGQRDLLEFRKAWEVEAEEDNAPDG